jgi:TetR/AcrR family transcriptional repressor of bet genes
MLLASPHSVRRQQILDATFEVIKREGIQETSIPKITNVMGVSKGIVHHYFKSREELIELSLRRVFRLRHREFLARINRAETPSDRLWAVISLNLDAKYLEPGFCRAWVSLSSQATEHRPFARLAKILRRRERSNVIHALRQLGHHTDVEEQALGLRMILEGMRHRAGFMALKCSPEVERDHFLLYLRHRAPKFDVYTALTTRH